MQNDNVFELMTSKEVEVERMKVINGNMLVEWIEEQLMFDAEVKGIFRSTAWNREFDI